MHLHPALIQWSVSLRLTLPFRYTFSIWNTYIVKLKFGWLTLVQKPLYSEKLAFLSQLWENFMTDQPPKRGTSWKRQLSYLSHLLYQSCFYKINKKTPATTTKKVDLKWKFENLSVIFKQFLYIWLGNRENSEFSFHISEFSEKMKKFCTQRFII